MMVIRVRGVILDIDGTLVDSNDAHAYSWIDAMEEQGYKVSFNEVRPLIGMGGDKILPEILNLSKESAKGRAISQRRKQIFKRRYLSHVKAFPGAWELLQHMHQQGLRLVIATSAEPDELNDFLQIINPQAPQLFEKQVSARDVKQSKPDVDVMEAALASIQLDPAEVVMLGDTLYDIEAASKLGVKTIAFRCGGWSDSDLRGAIEIYAGPADLLAHYDQSVLVRGITS
jgi:HAD superfamily hydrolase (TIGR01549 family)